MRAAVVDAAGKVLVRRSTPTPERADAPGAFLKLVAEIVASSDAPAPGHGVIGLPGGVDYDAGRLLWAPHLPESWPSQLSSAQLTSSLGLQVHVANDADLAAVGEVTFGAGVGRRDVVFVTVSTGIGAGVVLGGRLVRGRRSLAEVGHTVLDWRAWRSGCASTLEELASGSGVARAAHEEGLGDLDAEAVHRARMSGDEAATTVWHDAIAACAAGVQSLVMSFCPDTVIVGGGLGRQPDFFAGVRDVVLARPARHPEDLVVLPAALGDDAGLVGAAAWERALGLT
jgi:glucokinase